MLDGWRLTSVVSLLGLAVFGAGLSFLPMVSDSIREPPARPAVLAASADGPAVTSVDAWLGQRAPLLRESFEREVYGRLPPPAPVEVAEKTPLTMPGLPPGAVLEQWTLRTQAGAMPVQFRAVAVLPAGEGPFPVLVMENFCSNRAAFRNPELLAPADTPASAECDGAMMRPLVRSIFGFHIFGPPIESILAQGFAAVLLHPGEVVADSDGPAQAQLAAIAPALADKPDRPSAVGVWAWTFSRMLDALEADPRFDSERQALWGHSRYGKAALVAAAFDNRADAVIALQSGTGGATLSRSYNGESVGQITTAYSHWFSPAFAAYAGREDALPVDQHQLLALIAPRPILLGAARQDEWSDPHGAFLAAQGADAVYELFGVSGLDQPRMSAFKPDAEIGFFLRNGLHGITRQDWNRTLQFLETQFAKGRPEAPERPAKPLQPTPVRL